MLSVGRAWTIKEFRLDLLFTLLYCMVVPVLMFKKCSIEIIPIIISYNKKPAISSGLLIIKLPVAEERLELPTPGL